MIFSCMTLVSRNILVKIQNWKDDFEICRGMLEGCFLRQNSSWRWTPPWAGTHRMRTSCQNMYVYARFWLRLFIWCCVRCWWYPNVDLLEQFSQVRQQRRVCVVIGQPGRQEACAAQDIWGALPAPKPRHNGIGVWENAALQVTHVEMPANLTHRQCPTLISGGLLAMARGIADVLVYWGNLKQAAMCLKPAQRAGQPPCHLVCLDGAEDSEDLYKGLAAMQVQKTIFAQGSGSDLTNS